LEDAALYGTARLARPPRGPDVAGKTGTASDLGPRGPNSWTHAWFAGWAPAAAPNVVAAVFLENGAGGRDAAPLAARIFEHALAGSSGVKGNGAKGDGVKGF